MTPEDVHDENPVDTTELRWFASGSLPAEVASWFTHSGASGVEEVRTDTYRVSGRPDVGVKHRSGTTLELKIRQSVGEPLVLGAGLAGRTEVWRKWSPAASPIVNGHDGSWIEVRKRIVKRLFSGDGAEKIFSCAARARMETGCSVELAEVSVGQIHAWTFAFAAFGPASARRGAILTCWHALSIGAPVPEHLAACFTTPANYPRWVDQLADQGRPRTGHPPTS
jgi:hypothetical protein